ncbi:Coiled-coil alpha-helical rod protein 1 [Platysternon megacephalum]|uniref:Coiled-coil alpha-helical rod protein 1 n=1 Tax=Platysternon megacephalum TaxID=55544 RepID=A0A4D9DJ55_9SAUR|nr:Coiled-coil alpha-helical rod protein 1 [Platysternon megacephalum]
MNYEPESELALQSGICPEERDGESSGHPRDNGQEGRIQGSPGPTSRLRSPQTLRSLEREVEPPAACHALAISQQAELISHQLHELQRLEAELAGLRAAALQQEAKVASRESTVACLQGELEQLRGRSQAEGEALRAELEEQKKRGQAEVTALKAEMEELRRRGQAETNALRAELEEQRRRGQAEADALRAELETLRAELSHREDSGQRLQRRAEAAEGALRGLVETVSRLHQQVGGQEAELKAAALNLAGLGNRVTFAAKRVDTIQERRAAQGRWVGERWERDRLVAELKKGAQILEQQVAEAREKAERELREATWSLQGALEQKEAVERERRQQQGQLEGAQRELRESLEVAEGLRRELAGLRHEYERALQEKVTEVETRLRQDLSELEQRLSEARREHTKAVVALRQAERQAARDRARSQELAQLQEEAKREETGRLGARLQALERDKNLLMATLRQEGLLAQYKRNRLAARRDPGEPVGPGQQPPPGKGGAQTPSKETLAAVLDDLQSLSTALLREDEETPPGEEGSAEDEEGLP